MPMDPKIIAAERMLSSLRVGDKVRVKLSAPELSEMTVSREVHRSDGAYGSYESSGVTVTFGPGRYSTRISAEGIARGLHYLEPITARK